MLEEELKGGGQQGRNVGILGRTEMKSKRWILFLFSFSTNKRKKKKKRRQFEMCFYP
jgi:hypothetical protein